ncbi:MAG: hypothetical protein U1F30_11025 [Steroidobacteraceae bacterium]
MKRLAQFTVVYLALSAVAAVGLLVSTFPWRPHTGLGWAVLFLAALPALLAIEWSGTLLSQRNRVAEAVERRTRGKAFSWLRVGFQLCALLLVVTAVFAATILVGKWWMR